MSLKKLKLASIGVIATALCLVGSPVKDSSINYLSGPDVTYAGEVTSGLWKYEVQKDGTVYITNYAGFDTNLTIPSTIDGYEVSGIGYRAFKGNQNLGKVTLPGTVNYIGYEAFCGSSITSIIIPDTVTSTIPDSCFENCTALNSVIIGENVTDINKNAFYGCSSLSKLTLGKNVKTIGYGAFMNTPSLKINLNLGKVETLGKCAFSNCGITEVVIPSTVTNIQTSWGYADTFRGCSNLKKVTFNAKQPVRERMFEGCSKLNTVILLGNTTGIYEDAFYGCCALTSFRMGGNETYIGKNAFRDCKALKSIVIPQSVNGMGTNAFSNSGLTSIVIPSGVRFESSVGYCSTFKNCNKLTNVTIGDCIIGDGEGIFSGNDKLKINCIKGSAMDLYAKNNNISRAYITTKPSTAISFNKSSYQIKKGETLKLYPNVTPQNTTDYLTWTSGDSNIAKVDASGMVEAVSAGVVAIKVETSSGKIAACTITISGDVDFVTSTDVQNKKNIALGSVNAISNQIYTGSAITPIPVVMFNSCTKLIYGSDYTVSSYSNNVNAGTATVTITGQGNYTGTLKKTFKIVKEIDEASVKLSKTTYTYNGQKCVPTVTVKYGSTTLKINTDYRLDIKNNVNAGKATIIITGIGNYTGTLTKTFTINKAANKITAKSSFTKTASSKAQSFAIFAKATGGKLTYKSNSKSVTVSSTGKVTIAKNFAGKATITITAGGANHKTVKNTVTITVKPATTKVISVRNTASKKATVKWSKLSYVTCYQIQYSTSKSFVRAKTTTVTGASKVNKVLTGLSKGKTYYVRIRAYKKVGSTNLYSSWSAAKSVKISK